MGLIISLFRFLIPPHNYLDKNQVESQILELLGGIFIIDLMTIVPVLNLKSPFPRFIIDASEADSFNHLHL